MADTKKYTVHGTAIKHGPTGGNNKEHKLYEHGAEIELTDEEAAPLKKHLKEVEAVEGKKGKK